MPQEAVAVDVVGMCSRDVVDGLTAPLCISCGYNLTGIGSARCPECGWVIDWRVARLSEEERRGGSPAYGAKGWRVLPAGLRTVGLMLFRPVRFARCLRRDEPLLPALLVAFLAWWAFYLPIAIGHGGPVVAFTLVYGAGAIVCMMASTLSLVLLSSTRSPTLTLRDRLRLFMILSLYASCFVATWGLLGPPLVIEILGEGSMLSPIGDAHFDKLFHQPDFLARTVFFYWWATILWIFAFVRLRRSWARICFVPVPWLAAWAALWAGFYVDRALTHFGRTG